MDLLKIAVANGHLAMVQFLVETGGLPCTSMMARHAASFGHLAVMRYLLEHFDDTNQVDVGEGTA